MKEEHKTESNAMHQIPEKKSETIALQIPKPNMQVAVLGLIAFITVFQTFQLVRISDKASTTPVKAAPAATTTSSGGTGSSADVPESMVGGC
ncbi:MAG: hypothetical protein COY81_00465 [Candidatus Pacebacteria bacterium CG_4_10_14_0_8_um_filter_43_12]|uniref:Uncharacterized protein n=2 Tax=Candidatus Roizmaniibacteriota TaxID=1752723 RepID=A0A2M8F4X5_9BACT|nr:MAG: hypothetical protein COY81_00465 [Candidatus Pacebacteria bacterium CG_4_10_14_0_8_um_filter_43_12]PIZ79476.1 MAG: hypothetical protein COY01_00955 [Candidatus Pacebacteria bacterium CG_4_10_14_0_2_um_filter_40_20]PJC34354.1 MAG: hypothetical protein CO051_00050 [Candidatus Roizmanbacteria bacterium CG_4_9_14_0_2_um_filter_39_13]PJE61629.1 MAG: hypothetical protein COU87_03530 [Candidatus Roizmanbacteria bacterium CG10_big_fil_rev_8_21_14_0_10_39_12]